VRLEIRFVPNEFEKQIQSLRKSSQGIANSYDPQHPLRSSLLFLCNDPFVQEHLRRRHANSGAWLTVVRKLLEHGMLDPIEQGVLERQSQSDGKKDQCFSIPAPPGWEDPYSNETGLKECAIMAFYLYDQSFSRATWPWTVFNQISLAVLNKPCYWKQEYQRVVESEDIGPVGFLVLSDCFEKSSPPTAAYLAKRGLNGLSKESFLKDCEPFLDKDYWCGQFVRRLADVFRRLSDEDLAMLERQLNPQQAKLLAQCKQILRSNPQKSLDEALPELLGALWDAGLNETVQSALKSIRDRTDNPATCFK